MGSLFSSLATPTSPALPAPRRTSQAMVKKWLKNQVVCGDVSVNKCYADNTLFKVDAEGCYHLEKDAEENEIGAFISGEHFAYNARVLFREKIREKAGAPVAGKAYARWKAPSAKRGKDAQQAYEDFLRGLEVAGMQETLDTTSSTITPMSDNERREILETLMGQEIFPGGPVVKKTDLGTTKKDLRDLARWERFVALRRDATLRKKWYTDLHARATSMVSVGENNPKKQLKPLIRANTFKFLMRPAEVDFDPLRFLLMLISIFTFGYACYTQIISIVKLCPGPFMCPSSGVWKHRPVLAPPVALRKTSGFTTTSENYYRELEPTCVFGQAGCAKPGYKMEWPYLQTSNSTGEFPTGLKNFCKAKVAGTDGYVFDYISSTIRTEYWQCTLGSLPFMEAGTPFHFDPDWYDLAHKATIACMEEQFPKTDRKTWEASIASFDIAEIELCFLNSPLFSAYENGGKCNCKTDKAEFMIGGEGFLNDENINTHNRYGCFFDSPSAPKSVELEYSACAATPAPSVTVGAASKAKYRSETLRIANLPLGQYVSKTRAIAPSLQASRKTALLLFFLFKEGGPLVAAVGAFALAVFSTILAIVLAPIIRIVASFQRGPAKAQFIASMWNLFEDTMAEILNVIWPLSVGMSVSFRVWELSRKLMFSSQCNASIIKDGVNKVTGVLNIMFNLVVLIFSDANFTDQGILWISIILSVFNLVIQILVEKEKQKFITSLFKDINENRLHKFELALGITKCLEDFLEDDVQFNFVQQLTGNERVRPSVLDEYEALGEEEFNKKYEMYNQEEEWRFSNGKHRHYICGELQDPGDETIFPFYPLLPQDLADKFGDDGKYEFATKPKAQKMAGVTSSAVYAGPTSVVTGPATVVTMQQYPPTAQWGGAGGGFDQMQGGFGQMQGEGFRW